MSKLNSWLVTPSFLNFISQVEGCGVELLRFYSLFSFSWGSGLLQCSVVCLASWPIGHYTLFDNNILNWLHQLRTGALNQWTFYMLHFQFSEHLGRCQHSNPRMYVYIHVYLKKKKGTIKYNIWCRYTKSIFFFDTYSISISLYNNIHILYKFCFSNSVFRTMVIDAINIVNTRWRLILSN